MLFLFEPEINKQRQFSADRFSAYKSRFPVGRRGNNPHSFIFKRRVGTAHSFDGTDMSFLIYYKFNKHTPLDSIIKSVLRISEIGINPFSQEV